MYYSCALAKLDEGDAREISRSFLPAGTLLRGKYRIDGVIGTGGMAVVYAATHRNRKRFALKMLHPELSHRAEIRSRFIREGYLANSVEHPGVVSVLDDDVAEDGSAFLVMELLDGASVEGFGPRTRPLPLRESLAIAIDVLDVLDAAHAKNIVHRDIKPANLFVTRQGQVKILDFGIARLRDATFSSMATATGALLGTPAFMAPEQALALAGEVDARTDLWALGATVFTMLSGLHVHPGENARQVMVRAATEPAPSLSSVAPHVPAAVCEWVSQALQFDKLARWESAALMRAAALQIERELFGASEPGCAKRLFELHGGDFAHSPTELSPTSALSSVVRELNRSTLKSYPDSPEVSASIPALRLDGRPTTHAHNRRLPLALIAVATVALGIALFWGFSPATRPLETSLSAASPAPARTPAPVSVSSTPGATALGSQPSAPSATASASALAFVAPASSTRSAAMAKRSLVPTPTPSARVPTPAAPAASTQADPQPPSAKPAPTVAPKQNPLQLDIQ
ncbi:MAG: protein kinase [Pseudomonadota bacterium]